MASQDTYFKVKTGLGVGTEALYADALTKKVAIGATEAVYSLDVYGTTYSDEDVLVGNNVGIGTTIPTQRLDVRGVGVAETVGVGTTSPEQRFQVNPSGDGVVVITELGYLGINTISPEQKFQLVGDEEGESVVITGFSSIGIRVDNPEYDFHYLTRTGDYDIIINEQGFIGVDILDPLYNIDINGDIRISGLATITNEFVGVSTIGFATITNSYLGVTTVGLATITNEFVGVSTIGLASITNEFVGVSTIGFATITDSYLGITTIGFADITREEVLDSEIENLLVTGITTTAKLDVGIGATLIRARSFGITTVSDLEGNEIKEIHPIVGINTTLPTRTLDVSGDLRVRGEVIDSSNNVGYAYSVLASSGAIGISGRFIDGANLLIRNKEFIAEEIVGFITSTDGFGPNFDYGPVGVTTGREKCKRDIGLIIDAIAFDITKGGNSQSVGAGVSYSIGNYLADSNPIPVGFSSGYVKEATIAGISSIATLAQYVINNTAIPVSYQPEVPSGKFIDASNLILRNTKLIADVAVGRMLDEYPGFIVPGGNDNCVDDIVDVLETICFNLRYGGNSRVYDAAKIYIDNDYLAGEEAESAYAFTVARDLAIQAMRNDVIDIGGYTNEEQVFDYEVIGDSSGLPGIYDFDNDCADVASALTTYFTIITNAISSSTLPASRTEPPYRVSQYIDLEIAADGDSNQNILGCANVLSAIHSAVGIVTTIIDAGSLEASGIKLNNPSGALAWQPPGARIGNEWFVNKLGDDKNGGTGPGDAFLTIKKAASVAQPGDTIRVYAGLYIEDGPIVLNERVAVVGEDLRRTLVTTRDKTDLFYVKRGCYVAQMSFVGESNPGKAMVSFPTEGFGYADGTEENWQSPYVQNCTNFVPDSIGMRIDGSRAGGFKSMVLDAYTQYNQGGFGVYITNFGYAQLVSLFTICCDTAVYCDSGGVCDLNNSNSSFGNYGLWANGATPLQYTGTVISDPNQNPDSNLVDRLVINVGVGASQEFIDAVKILRENKDYIASEVVGFITSTSSDEIFPDVFAPFPGIGDTFDYGGSEKGREFCRRDSKIIIEQICSDILTLGNKNSIDAGLAYRDSSDNILTYLDESNPRPVGFSSGYVKDAEIAAIKFIAGISTYVVRNSPVPFTFQSGIGTFSQKFLSGISTSPLVDSFISNRAGIITSIIEGGRFAAPSIILPKGQRPYDGQIAIIDTQYYFISKIVITNPGSGYDPNVPLDLLISPPLPPGDPNEGFFIPAEAAVFEADIDPVTGSINGVNIISSGTGYDINNPPTITIPGPTGIGTTATAVAVLDKLFFNPISATPVSAGGTTTVVFDEFISYAPLIGVGSTVYFFQSSKVIASSITFEYVGTGINIVNAIPSKGAVPIDENQIVATNGGKVPFTSTDQSGDFRISEGLTINQNTGTISGQAFSKSLQAEVTPLILALQ
jgi:hypothetical protein